MSLTETHRYDDIIDLPHHQSQTHAHMSMHNLPPNSCLSPP